MRVRTLGFCLAAWTIALLSTGCSSSTQTGTDARGSGTTVTRDSASQAGHDAALQHFVDGSVYEMKGDYAQAVLEYQDALRYEKDDAFYFALSKCYTQLGKHTLAIENAREAVALSPDNMDYRHTLANAYISAYELDAAAREYEEIVKRDSNAIADWYSLARLYQVRNPPKALQVFEAMQARFGAEWDVLLRIADLYNQMGQFEKAASALEQMLALDPGNAELKRSLAQSYLRAQKLAVAETLYAELVTTYPDNLDYVGEFGIVHLLLKDYNTADSLFNILLSSDSVSIEAQLRVGEMYFGQVEKDSTLLPAVQGVFDRIRVKHPDDWRPYWFLGALGALGHDSSRAVTNFRKVTELSSGNADAWVYLSSVFLEKNDFQEVVTILEKAIKIVPDDFRVNFFLGVSYSRVGRNEDAARVLEKARQINPKDINGVSQLALVYDNLRRFDECDRLYEEGLRLDPDNATMLNNYGYSLADRNIQIDRAFEMARKAVAAQPDNTSFLDTIGWVYFRMGDYKEAEKYITRAIDKGEVNPVVHEHLGDVYYKMKDVERAIEQWKIALKMDENNASLKEKIARGSL
jgi:tetratricopeptide (TPR) repeat protein